MIVTARGLLAAALALGLTACALPPGPSAPPAIRPATAAVRTPPPVEAGPGKTADRVAVPADSTAATGRPAEAVASGEAPAVQPTGPAPSPGAEVPAATGFGKGLASWYGRKFHGRRTASGERYDRHALTAAHRTLPFGTRVRVHSEATGKDVVVRVNDRGPYRHSRIIDLSEAAIVALGLRNRGVTMVELVPE